MALVRILVDGYSLLHYWRELAPGKPRHSAAARTELIQVLTRYQDACGTALTVVFDGSSPARSMDPTVSRRAVEVLYSRDGQTADQIIERLTHCLQPYGEVLVVTDDAAERSTVLSLGGMASSCEHFVRSIESALGDFQRHLQRHNQQERARFRCGA